MCCWLSVVCCLFVACCLVVVVRCSLCIVRWVVRACLCGVLVAFVFVVCCLLFECLSFVVS